MYILFVNIILHYMRTFSPIANNTLINTKKQPLIKGAVYMYTF